jgi:ribosomal protein S18 acetylase RimI-like enzyme
VTAQDLKEPGVRIADPDDAAVVSDLLYEFNGQALSPNALAERMKEVQTLEAVFLGEVGGEPAGLLILRIVPTLSAAEDWAEITEMYVRPVCRRTGVGRALVQAAVDYGRTHGCTEMHLLVDPANVSAQAFYQAAGFCRDSWEMRRDLKDRTRA